MPINDLIPAIDNRRYADILNEARTRIPRYTPEWTDLNDNDPGIALVELFAWMSELLLYRLALVPEANYLKFLQLIGIELSPAEPATTEITFPLQPSFAQASSIVPARTQVAANSPGGDPPVVFETTRSLVVLAADLTAVQTFDGYAYADVTAANAAATPGFQPFGPLANAGAALLLGFTYAGPFPRLILDLAVVAPQRSEGLPVADCSLPVTPVYASAHIVWEYWNGAAWVGMDLLKDETNALTRSGHISLRTPAPALMARGTQGAITPPQYWIRARLTAGQYERPPQILAVRTNTVAAEQAQTARDEVLGGSNGRPNQVFQLQNIPVVHDSLLLEVDQGDGARPWTRVDDFFGSGPDALHYVLNRTTGEVRFGDGEHGAIPVANPDNPDGNVIAREYRYGGGKRGNVAAATLTTLLTSVDGVDDNAVTNLQAASGGREEETLTQAKLRAPQALKSECRAVTGEDFEFLAKQAAYIRRARALPLYHPDFPGIQVPGVVTVIVVPDGDSPNPIPSDGTLRTVCAYLNQRRLLTTELYVIAPTYQEVSVTVQVVAEDTADLAEVKAGVELVLLTYFHPLTGGEDGEGWPFGGTIYYSRMYQRVFMVPGVQRIESLTITFDGRDQPACTDVPIPAGNLVYSTQHDVQISYSFSDGTGS